MTLLHRLASIVGGIFRRHQAERDLNDELEAFVDMARQSSVRRAAPMASGRHVLFPRASPRASIR